MTKAKGSFRMHGILDFIPFDMWYKDVNGCYVNINKHFEETYGIKRDQIIGKHDYDLFPPVEAKLYMESDQAIITEGKHRYFKIELENGIFKEEYKEPIFDKSGEIVGVAGFSVDITREKMMNDALVESERSKSTLLSNLPGVAFRCDNDKDFTMTFLSEGCFELTGYSPAELLRGKPSYYDLILPEYRNNLLLKWKTDVAFHQISTDEYPIRTASGRIKWVWEQSQAVEVDGRMIASEGFITDVTEKKIAERKLAQSEERFRTIFEKAPEGIGIFNSLSGVAYQVNSKFAKILGRTKKEALKLNWEFYSQSEGKPDHRQNLISFHSGNSSDYAMRKRFVKPDGSIVWVDMEIVPFQTHEYSFPCHLCMIKDITEQRLAEERILYLSYHDQLTGLYNRRFYEQELKILDTEQNLPITIIMADVNGLKLTNDVFGHLAGDELLKKIASIIKGMCRENDVIARIGGDEFILLLPKTDSKEAEKLIRRMKSAILNEKMNDVTCSVSFGWETKRKQSEEITKIYTQAEDHMYRHKLSESARMRDETVKVIAETLYQKNKREQYHCERVSNLCVEIGSALGMNKNDLTTLRTAGLLHDIGKIGIGEDILNKHGALTETEWNAMKRHPEIGYRILKAANEFTPIAEYVLYHHERVDGKGYPRRLMADEIPLQSKIISIADSYDAMTNERAYKKILDRSAAIREIHKNAGTQFEPKIARVFVEQVLEEKWG